MVLGMAARGRSLHRSGGTDPGSEGLQLAPLVPRFERGGSRRSLGQPFPSRGDVAGPKPTRIRRPPRLDRYQKFGLLAMAPSLFLFTVLGGTERILFLSGILYGIGLLLHSRIEAFIIPRVGGRPLLAYGAAVVINGMLVETLAFLSNLDRIRAGERAFLFGRSLEVDLLVGLPYYVTLAAVYSWSLKRYEMTAFELALVIWLFWAMAVDEFSHLFALLGGELLGFLLAGTLMLYTLHGPIVVFESRLRQAHPERSRSWKRFPVVFILQALSLLSALGAALLVMVVSSLV